MKQHDIEIRTLSFEDDLNEITELLRLAYKPLADQGFKILGDLAKRGSVKTIALIAVRTKLERIYQ